MKEKKTFREVARAFGQRLFNGMRRYPAAIGMAAAASVIGIVLVHNDNFSDDTRRLLISFVMALVLGFLVSITMKTILENGNQGMRMKAFTWIVLGTGSLLYAMYLYTYLENMEMFEFMRFAAFMLAGFVLFMTAIFRKKTEYQEVFSTVAGWRLAITVIYTLIIWGGISLILFAIDRLLNVNIEEELYMDTIIIAAGFFAPMFFFGGIPKKEEKLEPDRIYKFFKILVLYVIAPLLSAYTVVFYIYALRILFNWNWPDGIVGNMVLWYALIGTVTMYFLHGMDKGSKWASIFGRWFPRVVILPLVLLFISLGIRINAYGFTATRFLLGAAGIWMLGSAIYMSIVNYKKRSTRLITVSLVVIALISVVGPWNAINIGRISQTNRLEKLLIENNLLVNGVLIPNSSLSDKTKGMVSDKLDYLGREYNNKGVDFLPDGFETRDMKEVFGFEYLYYYDDYPKQGEGRHIFINEETVDTIINVKGYDYIWNSDEWDESSVDTDIGTLTFEFIRDEDGNVFLISLDDDVIVTNKVDKYLDPIKEIWDDKGSEITLEELSFVEDSDKLAYKIVFTGLELYPENNGYTVGWLRFYVLVKLK